MRSAIETTARQRIREAETALVGIELEKIDVSFTIYQTSARSLKRSLYRSSVGGLIAQKPDSGRTVVHALQDLTLRIEHGERIGLIGHNGAGKTTLLRVLAGIYEPTCGRLRVDGRVMPLFDLSSGIDDEASGYENIVLRGLVMGARRSEINAMKERIAEFSGLGDYLDLPVRTYSSGMMMRLLFAIATSLHGDILLMDEWIATGDQDFKQKANARLLEMVDGAHILVFASHDVVLLQKLCSRAIWMEGGRVRLSGPVDEVVAEYRKINP